MPKKQARNAFWYFMTDWKVREEAAGRKFPNGFGDVQRDPGCGDAWRALTSERKAHYTNRAKQGKMKSSRAKQTGTGECVESIKLEEEREQDFKLNMHAHIRHTIFSAKKYDAVPSLKFLFLHVNWYYMREPDNEPVDFCPAEFAIAEFSLEEGITRYYHEIIRTPLHLGFAREAMETSERSHRLHWDLPIGEGDWSVIYEKIIKFLQPNIVNGKLPPIYTMKKILHVVPSLLRRMTDAVGKTPGMFLVYTVEALFSNMLRAVSEFADSNVLGVIAETQFSKERFAFTPNIECDYHKTQDGTSQFCSLSIVRQWAFTFCDHCNQPLGLELVPGVHCPESTDMVMSGSKIMNNSISSSLSESAPSVLSATGVSEQHRLMVSERNREEERRRRNTAGIVDIIDHSKFTEDERPPQPAPAPPVAVAVAARPVRPLRAPTTVSQALIGVHREVPSFDGTNFPIIGGRGVPMKTEGAPRRPEVPIWNHRSHTNSDDDSD